MKLIEVDEWGGAIKFKHYYFFNRSICFFWITRSLLKYDKGGMTAEAMVPQIVGFSFRVLTKPKFNHQNKYLDFTLQWKH